MAQTYTLVDLFAGCGGMTDGFLRTGRFQSVLAVESDRDAAATYALNFDVDHLHTDVIQSVEQFPAADVVVGGPPCQGFSTLNRRGAGLERRALWMEYFRALADAQPQVFVMENVPQLLASEEYAAFREAVNGLRHLGYTVEHRVLDAANFGVPQRRRRAIVVGYREVFQWPVESHAESPTLEHQAWRTLRDAVEGLPLEPDGRNWHRARNPRPESVVRYRAVPKDGGNRFEMERNLDEAGLGHLVLPCFRRKRTGTTDVFGRLRWDKPSVTIRTEFYKPEKGRYLHPTEDRAITLREGARCMSFDDRFVFPDGQSMTSVARQIGNAVPPLLAQRVAESIVEALDVANATARIAA